MWVVLRVLLVQQALAGRSRKAPAGPLPKMLRMLRMRLGLARRLPESLSMASAAVGHHLEWRQVLSLPCLLACLDAEPDDELAREG